MTFVYDPNCRTHHEREAEQCGDCHHAVCQECRVSFEGQRLCRNCSAARRDSQALIDSFTESHEGLSFGGPTEIELKSHPSGAVAQIVGRRFLGHLTIWRNGCCDLELLNKDRDTDRHFIHRVLVSPLEVAAFVASAYDFLASLEESAG
jgi:hypothetical protein